MSVKGSMGETPLWFVYKNCMAMDGNRASGGDGFAGHAHVEL